MTRRFLFRLDGSRDNDHYFDRRREHDNTVAYSGMTMTLGPGWIPDLIEVDFGDNGAVSTITLVELEASESTARVSCRKYLPEPSIDVLQRFVTYLDGVIAQCRASADPRLDKIRDLRKAIGTGEFLIVRTAGALRSSSTFLEVHTLIDQPERISLAEVQSKVSAAAFVCAGLRVLSRAETDGLRRTVRILHAVVIGQDHSGGTLHTMRNVSKPLDAAVSKDPERFVQLSHLLAKYTATGMRIDCDGLAEELAALWSMSKTYQLPGSAVADCIERFVPISMQFANRESMRVVYESARSALEVYAS